ncbi:MAG: hypothetical protein KF901_22400 [Myxococcales bacterium]|nr:hypothetical protein [Myxococcales bacterium]
MSAWLRAAACASVGAAIVGGAGCAPAEACVETECPMTSISFEELYATVLAPSCGLEGPSCHGPGGARSPSMVDLETARRELAPFVIPGDPSCSELVQRVHSSRRLFRMPPAESLDADDVCAIVSWVAGLPSDAD